MISRGKPGHKYQKVSQNTNQCQERLLWDNDEVRKSEGNSQLFSKYRKRSHCAIPQNTKHSILLVKTSDIYFVSSNGFILTTVFPLVAKIYWDEL